MGKGKKLDRRTFKNLQTFCDASEDSAVIMTPNAFIINEAWLEIIPKLCKVIHNMDVIRDHPYWWVVLSIDGFRLHVKFLETHRIFAGSKIYVVK